MEGNYVPDQGSIVRFFCSSLSMTPVSRSSVKPRVMTPQSSVNFPKIDLRRAQNSAKQYKKRVMRAVFAVGLSDFILGLSDYRIVLRKPKACGR